MTFDHRLILSAYVPIHKYMKYAPIHLFENTSKYTNMDCVPLKLYVNKICIETKVYYE